MKKKAFIVKLLSLVLFISPVSLVYAQGESEVTDDLSILEVSQTYSLSMDHAIPTARVVSQVHNGKRYVGSLVYSGKVKLIHGNLMVHYAGSIQLPKQVALSNHDVSMNLQKDAIDASHIEFIALDSPVPDTLEVTQIHEGKTYSGDIHYTGEAEIIDGELIFNYKGAIDYSE